jgi:hypothetical protein
MIEIVSARPDHVADLAPRLRALHPAEIEAATGRGSGKVLLESLDRALEASVALFDGRPIAIWGVARTR